MGDAPASRPARSAPSWAWHCPGPSLALSASTNTRAVAARSATVLPAGAATRRTFARHATATRPVPRTIPSGMTSAVTSAACSSDARDAACAAAAAVVSPGPPARARTFADDNAVTRLVTNAAVPSPLSPAATSIPGAPALAGAVVGGGAVVVPRSMRRRSAVSSTSASRRIV